jgi:hypothetical protein
VATGFSPKKGNYLGDPAKQASLKAVPFPAPSGGINAVDPLASLDPKYSVLANNFIADGRGLRVRTGTQQFATGVGTTDVLTIIPFEAATTGANKLFCAGSAGIYDVTAGGAGPWATSVAFGVTTGTAGYGVWSNFVLDNGANYVFYADSVNGLYQYPSGGPWVATGVGITGPAGGSADLTFVTQFKSKLWFCEKNSARAWYLASGTVAGVAKVFNFGNKFKHGGTLVGLYNWTMNSGVGIDDHLVALSSSGDVIIYKGSDPDTALDWFQIGQYYIGGIPAGNRQGAVFGGELFLLSQLGVLPLSRLMAGDALDDVATYASKNISPLITTEMAVSRTSIGWEMRNIVSENVFTVSVPKQTGLAYKQYAMSSKTNGWCTFMDLPYKTGDTYTGTFYIGSETGVIYRLNGHSDQVTLAGTGGNAITFSLITAFSDLSESALYHQVQFLRPVFRASAAPSYSIAARYDYNTDDYTGIAISTVISGYLWDGSTALWDTALWGADSTTVESVSGVNGIGRACAAVLLGTSTGETNLMRIDMMFTTAGLL